VKRILAFVVGAVLALAGLPAFADKYSDTVDLFKKAGESASFFDNSYGYAVFPTVAKGGLGVGAAHGLGRVYERGKYVGDTSTTQLSFGFQAGGQAYLALITDEGKIASVDRPPPKADRVEARPSLQ
jgi:hypothetical protein